MAAALTTMLPEGYRIPEMDDALLAECEETFFRSSGPGGQNVNRRETAVRLVHLPTGVVVQAQDERSQWQNRRLCLMRLRTALERLARPRRPRKATRIPRRAHETRLEGKSHRSHTKRLRRRPPDE